MAELKAVWNELLPYADNATPLYDWCWLESWWDIFGKRCVTTGAEGRLTALLLYQGDLIVAVFPMYSRRYPLWSARARIIRQIGSAAIYEVANQPEEPAGLIRTGFLADALSSVVAYLDSQLEIDRFDAYALSVISRAQSPEFERAMNSRSPRNPGRTKIRTASRVVLLPPTWREYRAYIGKSMRDNLTYYPRRLRKDGFEFEVVYSEPAEIKSALSTLAHLHRLRGSHNRSDHENYFRHEANASHISASSCQMARYGAAFIASLKVNGTVVSSQLFFRSDNELVFGYSGFDPQWAKYSPLLIVQARVIEDAIGWGIGRLNLLRGDAPWQGRWKPNADTACYSIEAASRYPIHLARSALHVIKREVTWLKRRGVSIELPRLATRAPKWSSKQLGA